MVDFTTVVGVDARHCRELRTVWPTWEALRPEILQHPLVLVCDGAAGEHQWHRWLSFIEHPDSRIRCWNMPGVGQREKMLTGLVLGTAEHVRTPWYLKLDTDVAAVRPADWLQPGWFRPDDQGREPAFVASPWSYTKPADAIRRLDDWGDAQPALRSHARLDLKPEPGGSLIRHRRIISWCFFGRTDWTGEVALACRGRLPVPSQDTLLWYWARRRGDFYRAVNMACYGWRHIHRTRVLRSACSRALAAHREPDRIER